ncbi:cytochrome P450 [Cercophora newfieldiana]|uniref:Cytochrome P450 n=1 Tax=Cercophora newfieldiana TaxID=92897 RepID=A0AA39YAC8_9PEZI|nr:cytochrome P450 [Cercophora newfieldiana]
MTPGVDSIFSTLDPNLRREMKRKVAPAYAGKGIDSFEGSVDRGTAGFLQAMQRFADRNDLPRQVHFFTLDTLGEVVYSRPMGYLENNKDMGNLLKINEKILPIMVLLSSYPDIFGMMHYWPLSLLMPREGDGVGAGAIMTFTRTLIDERFQLSAKGRTDMLQSFIRNGLSKMDILQEVTVQLHSSFAGTDTTMNTISMLVYHAVTNPRVYRRLQKEIDDANAAGLLSSPVKDSEIRQLSYLQACIRETLRIMPPIINTHFYKAAPVGGDTLCGYKVPYGVRVPTSPVMYAVGRDKSFWGDDADEFRPER